MAASSSVSTVAFGSRSNYYDVFINCRGPDVKKTLASHLYYRLSAHGFRVFLDQKEEQQGENISTQSENAIRTASVSVAIFSPHFAESAWCLNELILMLDSGAPIIPVFYNVHPSELRRTRGEGVYAQALNKHQKKQQFDLATIDNWSSALSEVSGISGFELERFNGDEGELLEKLVACVVKMLKKTYLYVAKHPIGLDEKVIDFETGVLLQQHSERVQVVGITGMAGVGKTTLAKELFNRKSSEYSKSFFFILFDERENAQRSLRSLQRELFRGLTQLDLHIDSIDQGIEMLRRHLSSSLVLLVLDGVDNVNHVNHVDVLLLAFIDVLHPHSLILITSRDKNVLTMFGVQESSIYKLTGLNAEHSRELFCLYAFSQHHPLLGYEYWVDQFLRACDGLPLSLKVVGCLLFGINKKSSWEYQLGRIERMLPKEIQQRLKICYDTLRREEQEIFLDIACFFLGESMNTAIRTWEALGWKGLRGLRILQDKCIVEVDRENRIQMHNHFRALAEMIRWDVSETSDLPEVGHRT